MFTGALVSLACSPHPEGWDTEVWDRMSATQPWAVIQFHPSCPRPEWLCLRWVWTLQSLVQPFCGIVSFSHQLGFSGFS